jgi:pimeloyl-ACP methyl ester carboxylesterase
MLSKRSIMLAAGVSAVAAVAARPALAEADIRFERDSRGLQRAVYEPQGWNFWEWQGNRIHYVKAGSAGPPVLLIHGYGASAYHWRYQLPALADAGYQVYALDLLGFGLSTKALTDYSNGKVWTQQIADFITEVIGKDMEPGLLPQVVLAGNSLGGYACLATAAQRPDLVRGLALLNSAGPLAEPGSPPQPTELPPDSWYQPMLDTFSNMGRRAMMYVAFQRAKQPSSIKQVLTMVYANKESIDDDLVDSIVVPATDPQASEVFYRINAKSKGQSITVNSLLEQMKGQSDMPLLLLWGDKDPWITPKRAAQMKEMYPSAKRVGLNSGHCPHDDTPALANAALLEWLATVPPPAKAAAV